jgi:hypothetical protein
VLVAKSFWANISSAKRPCFLIFNSIVNSLFSNLWSTDSEASSSDRSFPFSLASTFILKRKVLIFFFFAQTAIYVRYFPEFLKFNLNVYCSQVISLSYRVTVYIHIKLTGWLVINFNVDCPCTTSMTPLRWLIGTRPSSSISWPGPHSCLN